MIDKLHYKISSSINNYNIFTLSLFICLITLFFSMPPIDSNIAESTWDAIFKQINDPLRPIIAPSWSHNSKLTFRLFPVIIGKIFGFNKLAFIIFLYFIGFITIFITFYFLIKILDDKYKSFLLTLAFSFIKAGKGSFLEFRGIFDGIAILLLIISIYFKNPFVTYISILLASFTDERALIVSEYVFLYFYLFTENKNRSNYYNLFSILLAWISYFILRYLLVILFGFNTNTGGISLSILASNFEFFPLSLYSAFEGFWLIIFIFFYYLFTKNRYLFLVTSAMFVIGLIPCYLVFDVSRSLSYNFILLFVAITYLMQEKASLFTNTFCFIVLCFSFIFPCYLIAGNNITWVKPVILELVFRFFTNP